MRITVERKNPKGVYAKELKKWLNYSKFYEGNELQTGKTYEVELDGDFIMSAKEISNATESSLINSSAYLSLKLAVELYAGQNVEPTKVIQTARIFKAYLDEK